MNIEKDQYLNVFASCIIVRGVERSTICDLTRQSFELIPNSLAELLEEFKGKKIQDIYEFYGDDQKQILDQYFQFLLEKDMIFTCSKEELVFFPAIELKYESPSLIDNMIIDFDEESSFSFDGLGLQIKKLAVEHLQLRFFSHIELNGLIRILDEFTDCNLASIHIILPFSDDKTFADYTFLLKNYQIYRMDIFNTPNDVLAQLEGQKEQWNIFYFEKQAIDETHCGVVHPNYFKVNIELFTESHFYNSCLNKKICIDKRGNIKNCPSMSKSFGHIDTDQLIDIIVKSEFRSLWNVNKEKINVCKVCEFRYMCTDCRAYTENQDFLGKPAKCNYDPFTATWNS